ncbi:hypothetical protein PVL29_012294 [Vitis rotundifolia]|uniref:Phosphatidylinositol-glycan biosynthesis class F protein n=1 Tax=Vitis rotundifolia TaxID=103349 RepID=A0AA39DQM9_VITRO|nr:hypothetical protein PVL29_012294 [Vitis rotundifolia]
MFVSIKLDRNHSLGWKEVERLLQPFSPKTKIQCSMIGRYLPRTINWSVLMSLLTFVPAACVFGSSWTDWQRVFAHTKPIGAIDYMICLPAHGAIIGAWFGAWPMPLDWERPWQEWPVCVSYGAMAGYLVAMVASLGFALVRGARLPLKQD